ncbi:MAG: class I SAM-dependent methyltransferase [Proteobacteria bacterium]|nr:class I SAM-dependent methyltransferase [Pseudomonadota bacterium]
MSGFTADWLALREPLDRAARSADLAQRFVAALPRNARIADLGAGTGANLRYLAPLIGTAQSWRLIDHDAALLAIARGDPPPGTNCTVSTDARDLAENIEALVADADAVAASALMDLVSRTWFDEVAAAAATRHAPLLFALTVDGRIAFDPPSPEDGAVCAAFSEHQRRDKGFGPALGPVAPAYMRARLEGLAYRVATAPSDWLLGDADAALLRTFIEGFVAAAIAVAPHSAAQIEGWAARRRDQIAGGGLSVRVGHTDLFARM